MSDESTCKECGKPLQGAPFDGDGGPLRHCWSCGWAYTADEWSSMPNDRGAGLLRRALRRIGSVLDLFGAVK